MIRVWMPGMPKTKGSMEQQQHPHTCRCRTCATGRRGYRMVQSVQGSEQWAALVAQAVRDGAPYSKLAGPVAVRCAFWLPVDPISRGAGDGDKLERNVWDALTKAAAWGDDVQVVEWSGAKYGPDPRPGVLVTVRPMTASFGPYAAGDWMARAVEMGLSGA
jgi:Holliday junction resolvase RusA-like endonuclease